MVAYSGWIQAPDYEKVVGSAGLVSPAGTNWQTGSAYTLVDRPAVAGHYIPTPEEIQTLVMLANHHWTGDLMGSGFGIGVASSHLAFTGVLLPGDIVPSIARTTIEARVFHQAVSISPYNTGANNWAPFLAPGGVPADAIGWQWEDGSEGGSKQSSVVSAQVLGTHSSRAVQSVDGVETEIEAHLITAIDAVGAGFTSETLEGNADAFYADSLTYWNGPYGDRVFQISSETQPGSLPWGPVDITPHLDALGRVALGTSQAFGGGYPPIVPTADYDEIGSATAGYGHSVSFSANYMFRPPVFRWILEAAPKPIPTRLYPRGDDLGNTPRIFPRPITKQRSPRITGHY